MDLRVLLPTRHAPRVSLPASNPNRPHTSSKLTHLTAREPKYTALRGRRRQLSAHPRDASGAAAARAAAFVGVLQRGQGFLSDCNALLVIAFCLGIFGLGHFIIDLRFEAFRGGSGGGHAVVDFLQVQGAQVFFGSEGRRSEQGSGREQGRKRGTFHGSLLCGLW